MTSQKINSTQYINFVKKTTSSASSDVDVLIDRIRELDGEGVKLTHLLTFALGMIGELGETVDLIKKVLFQNKPYSDEVKSRIIGECYDQCWYLAQFCIAMDLDFEDLMQGNFEKLSARYPEGHFSVERSENRRPGDV
jgi:NTP pyrophosphatase (non-canonical NTP hydrolase)